MKIRKASKKDFNRIAEIFKEEYAKPPYNERWTNKALNRKLKEYYQNCLVFILEENKRIIGFIIGHIYIWDKGNLGFIDEIVISTRYQKKGYGKLLMKFIEDLFKKKGIRKVSLMTNTKSKAFKIYKKLNYQEHNFVSMEKILKSQT